MVAPLLIASIDIAPQGDNLLVSASTPSHIIALLAALSLAPFALMLLSSYAKITVVWSLVRSAIGLQNVPSSAVIAALAFVTTAVIMKPVISQTSERIREHPIRRIVERGDWKELEDIIDPLRRFLQVNTDPRQLESLLEYIASARGATAPGAPDFFVSALAFVLTELKEGLHIAALLFVPFLIVDLLVSVLLYAIGLHTLSPTQVALPLKIALFVTVDGLDLLTRTFILSYGVAR